MVDEPEFENEVSDEEEVCADEYPPESSEMEDVTLILSDETQKIQSPVKSNELTEEMDTSFAAEGEGIGSESSPVSSDETSTGGLDIESPPAPLGELGTESPESEEISDAGVGLEDPLTASEDVFVLLADDEIPVVEAQEVDSGDECPVTPSIADAGLKDVNPMVERDGEYLASDEGEELSEEVGVIDEIVELANDLDEDILTAEESDAGDSLSEEVGYSEYEEESFEARRFRASGLLVASLLAVVSLGAAYFFAIREGQLSVDGATAFAGGNSGTEDSAGVEVRVDLATVGVEDSTDIEDPSGGSVDGGTTEELSVTRRLVREQVQLVMKLGLQWEDGAN